MGKIHSHLDLIEKEKEYNETNPSSKRYDECFCEIHLHVVHSMVYYVMKNIYKWSTFQQSMLYRWIYRRFEHIHYCEQFVPTLLWMLSVDIANKMK